MSSTDFATAVSKFLLEYLPHQRSYSSNTVLSYRDTIKLFLRFISEEKAIPLNRFYMKDFNRSIVIEFLEWYRNGGAGSASANQRIAALKTFCEFAQIEYIDYISQLQEVMSIKAKKSQGRDIDFLTAEQVKNLINLPDINTISGCRHRVAMTLLYDSGARVQELCDLTIGDVVVGSVTTVRLHGKGNKYRTVVISRETGQLIKYYIDRYRQHAVKTDPLLVNRHNMKMDRAGISYIINKYVNLLKNTDNAIPKKVHCHMFRHSKAMHMLEAGINIVYIRDFLGHEDISTTMIYARADNRIKNKVINELAPKLAGNENLSDWNNDQDLMSFLNSLK